MSGGRIKLSVIPLSVELAVTSRGSNGRGDTSPWQVSNMAFRLRSTPELPATPLPSEEFANIDPTEGGFKFNKVISNETAGPTPVPTYPGVQQGEMEEDSDSCTSRMVFHEGASAPEPYTHTYKNSSGDLSQAGKLHIVNKEMVWELSGAGLAAALQAGVDSELGTDQSEEGGSRGLSVGQFEAMLTRSHPSGARRYTVALPCNPLSGVQLLEDGLGFPTPVQQGERPQRGYAVRVLSADVGEDVILRTVFALYLTSPHGGPRCLLSSRSMIGSDLAHYFFPRCGVSHAGKSLITQEEGGRGPGETERYYAATTNDLLLLWLRESISVTLRASQDVPADAKEQCAILLENIASGGGLEDPEMEFELWRELKEGMRLALRAMSQSSSSPVGTVQSTVLSRHSDSSPTRSSPRGSPAGKREAKRPHKRSSDPGWVSNRLYADAERKMRNRRRGNMSTKARPVSSNDRFALARAALDNTREVSRHQSQPTNNYPGSSEHSVRSHHTPPTPLMATPQTSSRDHKSVQIELNGIGGNGIAVLGDAVVTPHNPTATRLRSSMGGASPAAQPARQDQEDDDGDTVDFASNSASAGGDLISPVGEAPLHEWDTKAPQAPAPIVDMGDRLHHSMSAMSLDAISNSSFGQRSNSDAGPSRLQSPNGQKAGPFPGPAGVAFGGYAVGRRVVPVTVKAHTPKEISPKAHRVERTHPSLESPSPPLPALREPPICRTLRPDPTRQQPEVESEVEEEEEEVIEEEEQSDWEGEEGGDMDVEGVPELPQSFYSTGPPTTGLAQSSPYSMSSPGGNVNESFFSVTCNTSSESAARDDDGPRYQGTSSYSFTASTLPSGGRESVDSTATRTKVPKAPRKQSDADAVDWEDEEWEYCYTVTYKYDDGTLHTETIRSDKRLDEWEKFEDSEDVQTTVVA